MGRQTGRLRRALGNIGGRLLFSFQSGNTTHKLETEKLILSRIDKIFRIERNGKQFRFLNEKQFLKAFPDHKEELKKYADDNKTDFNEIEDVLQIYNHAVTL